MPLISIIIPTYNYSDYLPRCLRSVVSQNLDNCEVLVIDDGSDDESKNIISPFLSENISYVYKENGGVASARNLGIKISAGKFLIFLDADDELHKDAIENFIQSIDNNPDSKIHLGCYKSVWPDGKLRKNKVGKIYKSKLKNLKNLLISKNLHMRNGSYAIDRDIFLHGLFPEHMKTNEDFPIFAQAVSRAIPTPLDAVVNIAHKHDDSLRNQTDISLSIDKKLVAEIFDSGRLALNNKSIRKKFYARRCLSLMRQHHLEGNLKSSNTNYLKAIKNDMSCLFRMKYYKYFFKNIINMIKRRQSH